MEEKGEKSRVGKVTKRLLKHSSTFYTGRVLMIVFVYSYAEALQPVLNKRFPSKHSFATPPNPTRPCQQAEETFKNASLGSNLGLKTPNSEVNNYPIFVIMF